LTLDDQLLRFGWGLRVQRKKLETGLGLVSFDASCGSEPPIHWLLALVVWLGNDCFQAIQLISLLCDENSLSDHPLQKSLILVFAL